MHRRPRRLALELLEDRVTPAAPPVLDAIEPDPLTYHAGDNDSLTGSLTLAEQGATTITGATVSITAGFDPGEDQLHFTPNLGITSVYDADTGVLTLFGQASVTAYQDALQTVTFNDTNYDPAAGTRTVVFQVTGGSAEHFLSNTVSRDIAVTPHAGPSMTGIEGNALAFTEGDAAKPITLTLTLGDPDSPTLCGGYVYISSGFVPGQDILGYEETSNIDGDYDCQTGVLTLYGKATVIDWQTVLQGITYQNTSPDPSTAPRTISFWVDDNFPVHHASNIVARDVTIAAVNSPPAITVPASGPTTSQGDAVAVTGVTVADPDAEGAAEDLTLSVSHGMLDFADLTGVSIDGGANNSASITLSGTIAALNAALSGSNLAYHPDIAFTGNDTLNLSLDDRGNTGSGGAMSDSKSLAIAVNDHIPPALVGLETSALAYIEGDPATAITSKLRVSPGDRGTLAGATIAIGGYVAGEDLLAFSTQHGITGSFDPATGTLTLSGAASVADYQTALRSVTYQNTSPNPTPASRVISFAVDDGFAFNHASNAVTRTVDVTAVNNAPTLTVPAAEVTGARDTDIAVSGISGSDVDANLSSESLTLAVSHGKVRFASLNGLTVTGGANNSATVTVAGPLTSINAALAGGNLIYRPNVLFRGSDSLSLLLNDNGHSGEGGAKTDSKSLAITVTPAAPALSGIETTSRVHRRQRRQADLRRPDDRLDR
jgi:hypothetical protein